MTLVSIDEGRRLELSDESTAATYKALGLDCILLHVVISPVELEVGPHRSLPQDRFKMRRLEKKMIPKMAFIMDNTGATGAICIHSESSGLGAYRGLAAHQKEAFQAGEGS